MQHIILDAWFAIPGKDFYTYSRYTNGLDDDTLSVVRGYGVNLGGTLGWQVFDTFEGAHLAAQRRCIRNEA